MIWKRQPQADEFTHLAIKRGRCEGLGIPVAQYPIKQETLHAVLEAGGVFGISDLIRGLMQWLDVTDEYATPALILRSILHTHCPPDGREEASCSLQTATGNLLTFRVGQIDISEPLIAWQRSDHVFAIAQPIQIDPGRMVVAAPNPISYSVAESIIGHSMISYKEEPYDSIAGLKHSASRTAAFYSRAAGQTELMPWDYGYGKDAGGARGSAKQGFCLPETESWLAPNQLATLVAIAGDYVSP